MCRPSCDASSCSSPMCRCAELPRPAVTGPVPPTSTLTGLASSHSGPMSLTGRRTVLLQRSLNHLAPFFVFFHLTREHKALNDLVPFIYSQPSLGSLLSTYHPLRSASSFPLLPTVVPQSNSIHPQPPQPARGLA